MRTVTLAEVASINPRGDSPPPDADVSFVGMAELDAESALAIPREKRTYAEVSKGYTVFRDGDILAAKITPCWENGKVGQARLNSPIGVGSTEFHVIRPTEQVHDRYLLHFLRKPEVRETGELRMTGSAGQRRIPVAFLENLPLPLPDFEEQRRIAAILDQADALRAKRRQALSHLDTLTQSIFREMFGFGQFAMEPLKSVMFGFRNGLSPSTNGPHQATVLTLAAVTGRHFDPLSAKAATFAVEPPEDKRVTADDFLICRGNGNKSLVGVGTFSDENRPDLVFPDTVIAGTVNPSKVTMNYLNAAWKQPSIRHQIEAGARTTNGTHKINQQVLASIMLPLPPIDMQRSFDHQVDQVTQQQEHARRSATALDALFESLKSRAFRGEL